MRAPSNVEKHTGQWFQATTVLKVLTKTLPQAEYNTLYICCIFVVVVLRINTMSIKKPSRVANQTIDLVALEKAIELEIQLDRVRQDSVYANQYLAAYRLWQQTNDGNAFDFETYDKRLRVKQKVLRKLKANHVAKETAYERTLVGLSPTVPNLKIETNKGLIAHHLSRNQIGLDDCQYPKVKWLIHYWDYFGEYCEAVVVSDGKTDVTQKDVLEHFQSKGYGQRIDCFTPVV